MKLLALLMLAVVSQLGFADEAPLPAVAHVDLARYSGTWYEIARYPNWFEKDCASDVTAQYAMRSDGKVSVRNACRKANGKTKVSTGTAKIIDTTSNAKLKVSFFWPFYGDFWIIDLAPGYEYAVVGEPSRKYLWILSRSPQLTPAIYDQISARLRELGYDPAKLVKTRQG
jgi:apolipoprotein D and lipocalin family protein